MSAVGRIKEARTAGGLIDLLDQAVGQRRLEMEGRHFVPEAPESGNRVEIIIGIENRATANEELLYLLVDLKPRSLGKLLGCKPLRQLLVGFHQAQAHADQQHREAG